jgi:hypothetical protein
MASVVLGLALACSLTACGRPEVPHNTLPCAEDILQAQICNLGSADFTVRCCAATALGIIAPKVEDQAGLDRAVSALKRAALEDHEPTVRVAAQRALDQITSLISERLCKDVVRS